MIRINRPGRVDRGVETTFEIATMLHDNAPVAAGVSGGKDSCALAWALKDYLDEIGHDGPRMLVHSDLGRVEWKDSLPTCERLARATGMELLVVRRQAGDMMDRWHNRWERNKERYRQLSCVKLILPWSTPSMRFCTSELKSAPIASALVKRFPGNAIISAAGIRREESPKRKLAKISKLNKRLVNVTHKTTGVDWNPIAEWTERDVYSYLDHKGFALHEGYTHYGMSRISCRYCIMSKEDDLIASTTCPDNHDVYREQVQLEIDSTFAFQGSRWLGDVAPQLLDDVQRYSLANAKLNAAIRERIEAAIPCHLLYTKGWPTVMPTDAEAELLADVRQKVAALVGIGRMQCTTAETVIDRYAELMARKADQEDSDED